MTEKQKALRRRAILLNRRLEKAHPDAHCELVYKNPHELLIATILSAQCTDVRVNMVTKELFREFKTPKDFVEKPLERIEKLVKSTGFFRQKAKSIRGAMKIIVEEHGETVPARLEALCKLPGVGRKTANVVLGNAYGIPGITVDTHVGRITRRIGLTKEEDPVKVEMELNQLLPPKHWTMFCHRVIFHGRRVCKARKPDCASCTVSDLCDHFAAEQRRELRKKK